MTISSGYKVLAFAALLTCVSFRVHAAGNLDKYKSQLAAAAASAEPVAVQQENAVAKPAPPLKNIDAIDENELEDLEPLPPIAEDSKEIEPLRISLDKPEIVRLDRDAVNVIVGSNENLRVVPDTNKNLVLIAKKPDRPISVPWMLMVKS